MNESVAYFCGQWVRLTDVRLNPNDRGVMLGDAAYDVIRTFDGKPFRLEDHTDRLYRSLAFVRINPGITKAQMVRLTLEAVERNEHQLAEVGDCAIWQIVTRGPGRVAHKAGPPTVIIKVEPLDFGHHAHHYRSGVRTVITPARHLLPAMLEPNAKHFSRMHFTLASLEASDIDINAWAILLDANGNIAEGVSYNVLAYSEGAIHSPSDDNLLPGISRETVFDLAQELGIPVVKHDMAPSDLYRSEEVFLTATSFCLLPVSHIDGRTPSRGAPGPVYRKLMAAWSEMVGVDIVHQALTATGHRKTDTSQP